MTLKERLEEDYKKFFKEGNTLAVDALRLLKAEVKNAEIAKRKDFDDHEVLEVIMKVAKRHQDSIAAFTAGNRPDLMAREKEQLAVLGVYLPEKLPEDELRDIILELIKEMAAVGPKDFGRVMGEAMKQLKGQAEGGLISRIVREELNKKEKN